ncbi:unnamed protein product [Cylindrotheca closterium]|uniref:Uncharacterized protein n=1 Tax=Cylindrotheca closterium TaxID=2856 RepID=A0AAD2CMB0_9STRA|nr:unnamed protein product [Cylindrotheca closterium]
MVNTTKPIPAAQVHTKALKEFVRRGGGVMQNRWMPTEEIVKYIPKRCTIAYSQTKLSRALNTSFNFYADISQNSLDGIHAEVMKRAVVAAHGSGAGRKTKTFYLFLDRKPVREWDIPTDSRVCQEAWDAYEKTLLRKTNCPPQKKQAEGLRAEQPEEDQNSTEQGNYILTSLQHGEKEIFKADYSDIGTISNGCDAAAAREGMVPTTPPKQKPTRRIQMNSDPTIRPLPPPPYRITPMSIAYSTLTLLPANCYPVPPPGRPTVSPIPSFPNYGNTHMSSLAQSNRTCWPASCYPLPPPERLSPPVTAQNKFDEMQRLYYEKYGTTLLDKDYKQENFVEDLLKEKVSCCLTAML